MGKETNGDMDTKEAVETESTELTGEGRIVSENRALRRKLTRAELGSLASGHPERVRGVYIRRGTPGRGTPANPLGNPFKIGRDGNREGWWSSTRSISWTHVSLRVWRS